MRYLTAEKLGITEQERTALLKVKRFLKTLRLPENISSRHKHSTDELVNEAPALFYMSQAIARFDCGTAGCIGGWMSLYMQGVPLKNKVAVPIDVAATAENYVLDAKCGLFTQLFYPQNITKYDYITPETAVAEIEKFLKTGRATW